MGYHSHIHCSSKLFDDVNTTEDFIISYSNISSIKKVGYTTGFGLNVKASKADYHNKINITWEQPANLTNGVYPNIFYRESSSSVWNKVQLLSDGTQEYNLTLDDSSKCKTYEFAVTYYNSEQANFTSSYENYLAAICDSDGDKKTFRIRVYPSHCSAKTYKFDRIVYRNCFMEPL